MERKTLIIRPETLKPSGREGREWEHWYQAIVSRAYTILRDAWKVDGPNRSYSALARLMGISPSRSNDWTNFQPGVQNTPIWALMWLCEEMGYCFTLTAHDGRLIPYGEPVVRPIADTLRGGMRVERPDPTA